MLFRSRPGLWLTGEVVTAPVTDWSFTDKHPTIYAQTRTPYLLPHSVTITCVAHDGQLYLTSIFREGAPFPGQAVDQQRHARSSRPPEDRRSRVRPDGVARDRSGGTASGAREQGEEVPDAAGARAEHHISLPGRAGLVSPTGATTDGKMNPMPAATALGIRLTGLGDTLRHRLGSGAPP